MTKFLAHIALLVLLSARISTCFFFNQHQQEHEQQPENIDYQRTFLDKTDCKDYLCPTTLKCVKSYLDCPCPYPNSQMKCLIKDNKKVVDTICISKPFIVNNPGLQAKYDDPSKGYKLKTPGVRDCGWAEDAYFGRV